MTTSKKGYPSPNYIVLLNYHLADDMECTNLFRLVLALDKLSLEEDKQEAENAQTIRPTRSPSSVNTLLKTPPLDMAPIVEDYSDLASEEEDLHLQAKVANFKVSENTSESLYPGSSTLHR